MFSQLFVVHGFRGPSVSSQLELFLLCFFLISSGEIRVHGVEDNVGVWLMIPDQKYRLVEANASLTITSSYVHENDTEAKHTGLPWKWELPDFLTKHPQVCK